MKIKKVLSVALTMCIGASVFGAGAITASAESISGGWIFSNVAAVNVNETEKTALAQAIENSYDGLSKFEATDVIAHQVVEGSNSAYLCKETPAEHETPSNWSIVTIYTDLEGNSSVKRIETIDPTDIKTLETVTETESGAWYTIGKKTGPELSSGVQTALSNNTGLALVPTAVIAEQIVSGKNYRMLAYGTLVTAEPRTNLYVVDVYENNEGTAEITNIAAFDILSYCSASQNDPTDPEQSTSGGWQFSDVAANNAPEDAQATLDKVLKSSYNGLSKFEVTDIIASRVVAGTNYAYLCKETPADKDAPTNWSIVTLYSDLSGNTSLVHIETIDPTAIKTLENIPDAPVSGGWVAEGKENGADLPDTVQAAINSNMGLKLIPTAVIGEQVVAGINYRILSYGTLVTENPRTDLYIVDVNAGPDGTAQIKEISAFDITAYCSAPAEQPDEPSDKPSQPSSTSGSTSPATGDSNFTVVLLLLSVLATGAVISATVRTKKEDRS